MENEWKLRIKLFGHIRIFSRCLDKIAKMKPSALHSRGCGHLLVVICFNWV